MLKNLSKLKGIKVLNKTDQKQYEGGRIGSWPICEYFCDDPDPTIPCICIFP